MKTSLAVMVAAAAVLAGSVAQADAPPPIDAKRPRLGPPVPVHGPAQIHGPAPAYGPGPVRHRRLGRTARLDAAVTAPVYGREPRYYPGAGGASPNAGFGAFAPQPVAIVGYREAYIGKGLIYNTPPQPSFGASFGSPVISVNY